MSSTVLSSGPGDLPRPGDLLADKYRIEGVLGEGGMGVVLAARHLHLDERVAIKLLQPSIAGDASIVARFLREGRASIKIRSEHVVKVLDVATLPSGAPYMVMEFLEGKDLAAVLVEQGRLALPLAVDFLLQAMEAIAEAHALGLVHRDLKPPNLFLAHRADGSPCVKVLDFGISKEAHKAGTPITSMTRTHAVMGSPLYMSPEQMRSTRAVDARTDIWALGAILHELLTGAPPFCAETMPELLAIILQDAPPAISATRPDVPPALDAIVARSLAKDPAQRFANVGELAAALAPFGSPAATASAERIARVLRAAPSPMTSSSPAVPVAGARTTAEAPWMPAGATTGGSGTVQSSWPAMPQGGRSSTQASWGETGAPARPARPARSIALWVVLGALGAALVLGAVLLRPRGGETSLAAAPPLGAQATATTTTTTGSVDRASATAAPLPPPKASEVAPPSASPASPTTKAAATRPKSASAATSAEPTAKAPASSPSDLFDGRK